MSSPSLARPPEIASPAPAPVAARARPEYAVGVVNYRSYDELDRCLLSVRAQSVEPSGVFVVDGDGDPGQLARIRTRHSEVVFEARPNLGYAAGANRLLARIARERPGAQFVLLLNPDVELEADFARQLLDALGEEPEAAIAGGRLLRPCGEVIDSAGLALPPNRRPRDRGSEERDRGQYARREFVFGATGAAIMLRCAALPSLAIEGEIFDEDFFAYHEDTDLAWRAGRLGFRVLYEPTARARHTRGWRRGEHRRVPIAVRRHSFKNHYLQLIKNEATADLLRGLPVLLGWEVMRLGHALVFDRSLLPAYRDAVRLFGRALHKRRVLGERIAAAESCRPPQSAAAPAPERLTWRRIPWRRAP